MKVEINEFIIIDSKDGVTVAELALEAATKEILDAYPSLNKKHIKAALDFAAKITERNFTIPIPA